MRMRTREIQTLVHAPFSVPTWLCGQGDGRVCFCSAVHSALQSVKVCAYSDFKFELWPTTVCVQIWNVPALQIAPTQTRCAQKKGYASAVAVTSHQQEASATVEVQMVC